MPSAECAPGRTICSCGCAARAGAVPMAMASTPAARVSPRERLVIPSIVDPLRHASGGLSAERRAPTTGSTCPVRDRKAPERDLPDRIPSGGGAVGAGAEDLQGVGHARETMVGRHGVGPLLDGRPLDLDG